MVRLSDTILKRTHQRIILATFGLSWFSGFRRQDLNVKAYDVQQTEGDDDGHKMITIDHIALSQAS
jgi:hypothetical protein